MKRLISFGVLASALLVLTPGRLAAQDNGDGSGNGGAVVDDTTYGTDTVKARFVGVTGGAILGAEAVMIAQAAFGVDKLWPYLVFPVLGAGAGGVGGYYMEKWSVPGAVALLVSGIALVIPAAVITASAFAYDPEKDGATMGDERDDGRLGFELPPEGTTTVESESGAVTEVEAPPDVGPPGTAVPSSDEDTAPSESPETEPGSGEPTSLRRPGSERSVGVAYGVLLNVASDGSPGLGIPSPAVRPAAVVDEYGQVIARRGVEVMVPLLRIELP